MIEIMQLAAAHAALFVQDHGLHRKCLRGRGFATGWQWQWGGGEIADGSRRRQPAKPEVGIGEQEVFDAHGEGSFEFAMCADLLAAADKNMRGLRRRGERL